MNIVEHIKFTITPALDRKILFSVLFLVGHLFFVNTADAEEDSWLEGTWIPDSIQIHGFLSQGLTHTSDNNFFGESDDDVSFDFREIGINGSWRIIPEFQLAVQVVYRDAGLTDEDGFRVDYGLADYSFFSSESTLMGIRAGRVPTPYGFYNDTRDVASTRPGIILPQSIYFDVNRNFALSADGGYFYGEHRTEFGDFLLHAGVVNPRTTDPDFKNVIVGSDPGKFRGDTSFIMRLNYEWQSGRVRLGFSYADFNADYVPEPGRSLFLPGSFKLHPFVFSFQFNAENWSLTSEYLIRKFQFKDFGFPDIEQTGDAFYVQGTYRFNQYIEGMVRYDQLIWDWNDRDGEKFAALTGQNAYSRFAKDWTVGLRFTLFPKLLLSAEYHHVNGTGWLSGLENPDPDKTKKYWNLYMMMISYDF